jgi:hypothetical protein
VLSLLLETISEEFFDLLLKFKYIAFGEFLDVRGATPAPIVIELAHIIGAGATS